MHRGVGLLSLLVLAALLAGCGASARHAAAPRATTTKPRQLSIPSPPLVRLRPAVAVAPRPTCRWTSQALGSERVAVAAVVRNETAHVFRRPGRQLLASFGALNQNGYPTVFRAVAAVRARNCHSTWYRVQLPMRPNGLTGYVSARAVAIEKVHTRIVVDLSSRKLTFLRDAHPVLQAPVAVGAAATPTPTGRYYVNQKLLPVDERGPYGPGAIGISAFSPVLTGWAQGGPVAIHGTNEPWSIGRSVSNGCIRLHNPVLRRLFAATPAGTPVLIRR